MTGTVALAQIAPVLGDVDRNIARHVEIVRAARDRGARLVVFPELSLTGYIVRDLNFPLALRPDDPRLDVFRSLSADITIVLGGIEESAGYGIYNAAFVFDAGTAVTYRKIYPPDYGIFEEGRYFLRGSSAAPVDTSLGRVGVLVCEDLWHVSLPLLQALDGAQLIVVISASPARLPGRHGLTNVEINHQHHAALCRLLSVNMVFVNRVGFEDGIHFWGGSEIVDASGLTVVAAEGDGEEIVFGEIADAAVRAARRESRHFLDEDIRLLKHELDRIAGARP